MRKLSLFILASFFTFAFGVASADVKIGVFNLNQVLQNDPNVKVAQEKLKNDFSPAGKKLIETRDALAKDIDALRSMPLVQKNERKDLTDKIVKEDKDFRDQQVKFQNDLTQAQNTALQAILERIKNIVNKIAKRQGLNLVLTESNVAYSETAMDITDQVSKELKEVK
jgi:outer membrane protein